MNKTPDLAAIMASYTQQHNAMMARSAANRKAFAEGRPQPYQAGGNYQSSQPSRPQSAPQPAPADMDSFDDDIPF